MAKVLNFDFNNLRDDGQGEAHSFEELCCQIFHYM